MVESRTIVKKKTLSNVCFSFYVIYSFDKLSFLTVDIFFRTVKPEPKYT